MEGRGISVEKRLSRASGGGLARGKDRDKMKPLKELEGTVIAAIIPMYHQTTIQKVRLLKVEDGGLWIENHHAVDLAHAALGLSTSPGTMTIFLPWHHVACIFSSLDETVTPAVV